MTQLANKAAALLLIVAAVLLAGCIHKRPGPKFNREDARSQDESKAPALVVIYRDKAAICSGAVISRKYVLTAAHCLSRSGSLSVGSLKTTADVTVAAYDADSDLALLAGDVSKFNAMQVVTALADTLNVLSLERGVVISCGFPQGGEVSCEAMRLIGHFWFMYSGSGTVYPGMSGGPVFSPQLNAIVAINHGVYDNFSIYAPTVELFKILNIEVEDVNE